MNSKKKNTKKRRNFGNNLFFPHTELERALPQQKVSKLDICFVSPSLLLLFLTETLAAFFHILYFANISIENLKTKTLANTFGLHLRIVMTVPNWNSEDNGKLFTLFNQLWMRQFSKASWQKHRKLLPIQVKSQKANFWGGFVGFLFGFVLIVWVFFNGYSVLKWRNWDDNTWCCPAHLV